VSVAIHAGPLLQFYFRGVFNGILGMCPGPLNHGVTAVCVIELLFILIIFTFN